MEAITCKKELVIEIPVDVVQREADSVAGQFAKRARIPGFRPGRAPNSLVRQHFRDDIRSEVAQTLIPRFFQTAVKEQKWEIVGQPRFEDLKFEDNQPLTCKATFEIYPDFELQPYKELEVEEEKAEVTDADVDKAVEDLRERAATFEVVADRPAADDDHLTVNYRGQDTSSPASQPTEAKDAVVHLGGKHTVEAFTENLRGAKAGEVREFPVTYAADYPQKTLAGKTFSYRVEIQSIKKKVVPPVDDELAKSVSEFATLEELRTKLHQDLEKSAQRQAEMGSKQKLAEKLLETNQFPVPEVLVETQLDRKIERTLGQLMSQGIDPRQTQVDWRKVREEARPEAEKEVRVALILGRVADAEKIEFTEEELDDAIREMAQERRMTAAELKTRLTRDGKLDTLKSTRRNQKALDYIYRNAKIIRKNALVAGPDRESP
ncbi:MAG TPA: trigger factor [Terriglobia bacterium]|nr:trigger factor [Terriglobia bacterium]